MGYQSKITSKGQTTIPQEVREFLKLKPGDRIRYVLGDNAVHLVVKNRSLSELAGVLGKPAKGVGATLSDMDRAMGDHLAEDERRIEREWNESRK